MYTAFVAAALSVICQASARPAFSNHLDQGVQVARQQAVDSTVNLDEPSRRRFDLAFRAISEQGHVAIFVEGAPLKAELNDDELVALNENLRSGPVGTQEAIEAVANAFDYSVERKFAGTFLLRKHYSDPRDLPCVTYEEVVSSLQQMIKLTEEYAPPLEPGASGTGPTDSPQTRFAASLTQEQLATAARGISATQLDSSQRDLALRAAEYVYVNQWTTPLRATLKHLQCLKNPSTIFKWITLSDQPVFVYKGPFGLAGAAEVFPLTNGFQSNIGGYSRQPPSLGDNGDPSLPSPDDVRLAQDMFANHLACTISLHDAVLLGKSLTSAEKTARVSVNDAIANKPVSTFGAHYCTQDQCVRSVAALYGLRLVAGEKSVYFVTLPVAKPSTDFNDIATESAKLIPQPLTRYFAKQTEIYAHKLLSKSDQTTPLTVLPEKRAIAEEKRAITKSIPSASHALYFPAIRRLLVLAERAVPTASSPPVSVVSLSPEVPRLIALAMISGDCARDLVGLENFELPAMFLAPDKMSMIVGYRPGIQVVTGFCSDDHRVNGMAGFDIINEVRTPQKN